MRYGEHTTYCTLAKILQCKPKTTLKTSYFLPPLTVAEQRNIHEGIAMFFLETGTSFSRVENETLWKTLTLLRPDVKRIGRSKLSGPLLDDAYDKVKDGVQQALRDDGQYVCLTTDGWSTVDNKPLINYCAVTPENTFFLEAVYTKTDSHTAEFIAADITRVIESVVDVAEVAGCVTDNTKANKKAWRQLEETYPSKYFYGCVCHALHLLVKDLVTSINWLSKLEDDAKEIVKFFRGSGINKAELVRVQQQNGVDVTSLHLPGATRWGSLLKCFESLLDCVPHLFAIVNSTDFESRDTKRRSEIKKLLTNSELIASLQKGSALLKLICDEIVAFQNDRKPISDVYHVFQTLTGKINALPRLDDADREVITIKVAERWNFIYSDAHGLSYMFDPRYAGQDMDDNTRHGCLTFIEKFYPAIARNGEMQKFNAYLMKWKSTYHGQVEALTSGALSPLLWWQGLDNNIKFPALRKVAMKLFTLCASSAASERNFSSFSFIHTKLRNRLSDEKVVKSVYVYANRKNLMAHEDTEEEEDTQRN